MTVEQEIAELLAQAEPLRALSDEESEKAGLGKLVDRINALRALGEPVRAPFVAEQDNAPEALALRHAIASEMPKRKPGRPRATVEGADA